MIIRLAEKADYIHIVRSLQNKKIAYNTPSHIRADLFNHRLFVIEEKGKIIAQCALVEEPNYGYTAIKRLCIYNKKNCGRGLANAFIEFFADRISSPLGCTPWEENVAMRHILEKNGFVYQYTFLDNYQFYLRSE